MPKGGARPGAGRPQGSTSGRTRALVDALEAAGGDDLVIALARVIDDTSVPLAVRCEAARHLSGAALSRVIASVDGIFR